MEKGLAGKVALVAGATRGAGRGIAVQLGAAGATVYATGRTSGSQRSEMDRSETIEETAALVDAAGGRGIPVQVDHLVPEQVAALVQRIESEQGALNILVNDIFGATKIEWEKTVWESDLDLGLRTLHRAVDTHAITSHYALPLLLETPGGLVVEVNDGTDEYNSTNYRVSFFYDLAKASVGRMAFALAHELQDHDATAVSLTPGWLRSEEMLDAYRVTEDTWLDATKIQPHFAISETPAFVGRAVVALAAGPRRCALERAVPVERPTRADLRFHRSRRQPAGRVALPRRGAGPRAAGGCDRLSLSARKKVAQQVVARVGEDRLGMELHAFDGELAVPEPHHQAVLGLGRQLEHVGNRITLHDERVVARRGERIRDAREHADITMADLGGLPVHHARRPHHVAAVELADALQAEADAEHRDAALAEMANRLVRDAGIGRPARARRHEHRIGRHRVHLVERDRVVTVHDRFGAELTEVLHEVVDERVVVVDHQNPRAHASNGTGAEMATVLAPEAHRSEGAIDRADERR